MKVTFLTSQAQHFSFTARHDANDEDLSEISHNFDLSYFTLTSGDDPSVFATVFDLQLKHPGQFEMSVAFVAWFKSDSELPPDFKNTDFAGINAPSIAYPYLRSFVGATTVLAGYEAATLPVMNFVSMRSSMEKFPE